MSSAGVQHAPIIGKALVQGSSDVEWNERVSDVRFMASGHNPAGRVTRHGILPFSSSKGEGRGTRGDEGGPE